MTDIVSETYAEFRAWRLIRERLYNVFHGFAEAARQLEHDRWREDRRMERVHGRR